MVSTSGIPVPANEALSLPATALRRDELGPSVEVIAVSTSISAASSSRRACRTSRTNWIVIEADGTRPARATALTYFSCIALSNPALFTAILAVKVTTQASASLPPALHSFSAMQEVTPSPSKSVWQAHVKLPSPSMHTAFPSQLSDTPHSTTSVHVTPASLVSHPTWHAHVKLPCVSVHDASSCTVPMRKHTLSARLIVF
eukprot:3938016-Rhodomonas_salina.1